MGAHVLTPMSHQSDNSPVTRLVYTTIDSRRQMLVSNLFKHMKEVQSIDDGYALRFQWSDDLADLIEQIADYILFESRNSPQLTFAIVEEPRAKAFWLQVRSLVNEKSPISPRRMSRPSHHRKKQVDRA